MMSLRRMTVCYALATVALVVHGISAQTLDFLARNAELGMIVRGAPYSAEGTTTLTQTLGDGTRIERSVSSRFFRDSAGRVRREQTIVGLSALNPASESQPVVTIVDPVAQVKYVLDPRSRVARRSPMDPRALGAPPPPPLPPPPPGTASDTGVPPPPPPPPPPPRPDEEVLGRQQIEGLSATGRRTTLTIPAQAIGNDRAIRVVDERWESPELAVLLLSRHHDPRTGDIEFRLTNISRVEPPADLFEVPPDYEVVDAAPRPSPPPPPPPPPGHPQGA